METMMGHIVVEMEELEALISAKNVESMRALLSCACDTYRPKYDKFTKDFSRQSIFIGTSNDAACLPQDRAGNRRLLPIQCDKNKAERHPLDNEKETRKYIMMCFAQAMDMYKRGKLITRLPSEWEKKLPEQQKGFLPEDTKASTIEQWIHDHPLPYYCIQMICDKVFGVDVPKEWMTKEVAIILDSLRCSDGSRLLRRYEKAGGIRRFTKYGRKLAWYRTDRAVIESELESPTRDRHCVQTIYHDVLGKTGTPTDAEVKMIEEILDGLKDDDGKPFYKRDGIKEFEKYGEQPAWICPSERMTKEKWDKIIKAVEEGKTPVFDLTVCR